ANVIDEIGEPPLPPYIKRSSRDFDIDRERYQTVYARERGAIAAPTAGLHFTQAILQALQDRGTGVVQITLHVGYGTFAPVRTQDLRLHSVAPEWYSVTSEAADAINEARTRGGRCVAVGTTTTRALEYAVSTSRQIEAGSTFANLTILPGYQF